ncbi:PREDICTED: G-type lectin S-receptor-like serine/threonine-protein kinase At1g11300 isoform X1 [Ipomoea nil]|uniref:G-type lectin S-receptor-like serine/threonine-protein kinase At1g11300 isoform X1 n=1 Tax=Ipomoea nil TaxID=35883 RepID=UPI0009013577|nr:PREDICTED: G-type lectin S-receptor-like serine/threonine-protein kinase At1g11300 isoform X1 [Ipomoea nil]
MLIEGKEEAKKVYTYAMEFRRKVGFLTLCHHLFLTISFFCLQFGVSTDTITAHHSLEGSETILSNSQNFKMEFFRPENSTKYYVGIMFNVPSMAVVWVANRDKGMDDSRGSMGISEDGNLLVLDGEKRVVWSSTSKSNISTSSSPANTTAQLLDTGNLVLKDNSSGRYLWESFGEISNTAVEGMKLGNGSSIGITRELRSWKSPWDPSPGTFSLRLRHQNIPEVIVLQNNSKIYWRTGLWNKQIFIGSQNMNSGYDYGSQIIKDVEGNITYDTFKNMKESTKLHYVLNSDGCYVEKHWDEEKSQWVLKSDQWVVKSEIGISGQQCDLYDKCGPFGIYDPYASKSCSCLKGYRPKDEMEWGNGNWSSGCIINAALQCHRNSSTEENNKKDGFLKLQRVKVPDLPHWVPSLDETCETDCLRDCACIAYSYYTGIGCMHWFEDLIDIQQFSTGGADLYIRLPYSEFDQNRNNKVIIIVITLTIGSLAIASCLYFGLLKHRGKKSSKIMPREDASQVKLLDELPTFDFEIIAKATEHFHSGNKLGEGGFGSVYKGVLEDGQEIAVKRLSESSAQGQKEFMNEVVVISKLQHRNLVRLLGCCIERGEKMLVYEFMPNGSLDSLLFDPNKEVVLDWTKRLMIIEGIGRGLLYLHRDSRLRIVHRDLKASNILLDEQLNPKISDFGLARIFGSNENQAKTQRVIGTYGYMAPEYAMNGKFSEKSDVFSFGVLLLEIVSGRKNSTFYHDDFAISLAAHAWKLWNLEKMEEMAEPEVYDMSFKMSIRRCVHIGLLCVQEYADDRPNVSTVLSMLSSEIVELPHPKQPAFTGRQRFSDNKPSKQSKSYVYSITISDVEGR